VAAVAAERGPTRSTRVSSPAHATIMAMSKPGRPRRTFFRRPPVGLRVRTALSFGIGALAVAAMLATSTFLLSRSYLLDQRESGAQRQTFVNARLVRDALAVGGSDVSGLLSGFRPDGRSDVVVNVADRRYSTSVAVNESTVPNDVMTQVRAGGAVSRIVDIAGRPTLIIGVALPEVSAEYYEFHSLEQLAGTLDALRFALTVSALIASAAGALLGLVASGRVLRPVNRLGEAATHIASGSLDLRLEVEHDPDLEPVATSFNAMVDTLQDRIQREARFSSDVSHELRTPIAAMSAALSIARRRQRDLPEDVQQVMNLLNEQLASFRSLTEDLLAIARVDAGLTELNLEAVHPAEFARQFVDSREDRLDLRADDSVAVVLVDKRRLRQVFENVVNNAECYAGGADVVEVRVHDRDVEIRIGDRGPGVEMDERDAIFGRFARGSATKAVHAPSGSGLGLALAREHLALMGGRIWVEDRDDGGSWFVVELPAVEDTE